MRFAAHRREVLHSVRKYLSGRVKIKHREASMEVSLPRTAIAASQIFYLSLLFISSATECEKKGKRQRIKGRDTEEYIGS